MLARARVSRFVYDQLASTAKTNFATRAAGVTGSNMTSSPRAYPTSPKVGIGVVLLRRHAQQEEVLLVRRGKEPQKGKLTFPGGSLELGETMAECAARELLEETGLVLRNDATEVDLPPRSLAKPRPVDAVDCISYDSDSRLQFHYTIVDVAALPESANAVPEASDDAEEVLWIPVKHLRATKDVDSNHARIAEAAVDRFDIPAEHI